jgi:glycosyltransferase involved in cell wall biosynthesis
MIVKNEEKFIRSCLKSVQPIVNEFVIADTGSTDGTIQIAREFDAKIINSPWTGSFSKARNESLQHATGDWILLLDADETIAEADLFKIKKLIQEGKHQAYFVTTRNYTDDTSTAGWRPCRDNYEESKNFLGWFPSTKIRLFQNSPEIYFEGEVHECVEASLRRNHKSIGSTEVPVHHFQELKGLEVIKQKQLRYLKLCLEKIKNHPDNADTYYEIGKVYNRYENKLQESLENLQKAINLNPGHELAHYELAEVYRKTGRYSEAIEEYKTTLRISPRNYGARKALEEVRLSWGW